MSQKRKLLALAIGAAALSGALLPAHAQDATVCRSTLEECARASVTHSGDHDRLLTCLSRARDEDAERAAYSGLRALAYYWAHAVDAGDRFRADMRRRYGSFSSDELRRFDQRLERARGSAVDALQRGYVDVEMGVCVAQLQAQGIDVTLRAGRLDVSGYCVQGACIDQSDLSRAIDALDERQPRMPAIDPNGPGVQLPGVPGALLDRRAIERESRRTRDHIERDHAVD